MSEEPTKVKLTEAEARAVLILDRRRQRLAEEMAQAQDEIRAVLDAYAAKYGLKGGTPILFQDGGAFYLGPREKQEPNRDE